MFPPKGLDKVSTYLPQGPGNKDPAPGTSDMSSRNSDDT